MPINQTTLKLVGIIAFVALAVTVALELQPKGYTTKEQLYIVCEDYDRAWYNEGYATMSPCVMNVETCVKECQALVKAKHNFENQTCIMDGESAGEKFKDWVCGAGKISDCQTYQDDKSKFEIYLDEGCSVMVVDYDFRNKNGVEAYNEY